MNHFQVTRSMLIDALPIAEGIEHECGQYFHPAHVPVATTPQMVPGQWYDEYGRLFQRVGGPAAVPTVVNRPPARTGQRAPSVHPARGIAICVGLVDSVLQSTCAWGKNAKRDLRDVVHQYVLPQYQTYDELFDRISDLTLDMRQEVRYFVADDAWIMHFHMLRDGRDIVVEKTIDYRIFDWQRRMAAGEWK